MKLMISAPKSHNKTKRKDSIRARRIVIKLLMQVCSQDIKHMPTVYYKLADTFEIEDQRTLANRVAQHEEVRNEHSRKSPELTTLKQDAESDKNRENRELQKDPTLPVCTGKKSP